MVTLNSSRLSLPSVYGAVRAVNVLVDGCRDPRGLAYIHTELSHQHTGHSAGHTLCASTSPFTHAVSS